MSLKAIIQGIGKKILGGKKVSSSPATGKEQKLLGYEKESLQKTGQELAEQEFKAPVVSAPLKKTKPLHMGDDQAPIFGSSTYDWVMKKGRGEFSADEWLDHLTSTRKVNFKIFGKPATKTERGPKQFKYDSGPFAGKEVTINKEELFDSNLASFNEAGDLTGGLLYAAKKFGLKLDANTLGSMIKLNPVNRLQPVELGIPKGAMEKFKTKAPVIQKQIDSLKENFRQRKLFALEDEMTSAQYQSRLFTTRSDTNSFKQASKSITDSLNRIRQSQNLNADEKRMINQLIGEVDDVAKPFADKTIATRYKGERSYTLEGGDDYRETVWRLNEDIPGNSAARKTFGHFDGVNENMVYHVRYDTRYTPDGKKVFLIHEIQSDANQKVAKALTKAEQLSGEKRINPFQKDIELNLLSQNRSKMLKEMDEAIEAGQTNKANAIAKDLGDINEKMRMTYSRSSIYGSGTEKFDYFPLVEADAYGDHALKYLLNKAAKENVDYVAVAPFDKLSYRQGYKKGNERFYGYASGKGIDAKGKAVMPEIMKKTARFYNSKAGPEKISFSDPKKPYKEIDRDRFKYPETHKLKGKEIDAKYHRNALSKEEYEGMSDREAFTYMDPSDPNLYFDAFAIKVSPLMRQTLKTYRKEGGLVVDIFKPIR
jgi:hypothetical protein